MQVVQATWEQRNLGKKVVELSIEPGECDDVSATVESAMRAEADCELAVVKLPKGYPAIIHELEERGHRFLETQLSLGLPLGESSPTLPPAFAVIARRVKHSPVADTEELEQVLARIDPEMFTTDRVALDPLFGRDVAMSRYRNWLRDLHGKENHALLRLHVGDNPVGFLQVAARERTLHALLGGVYVRFKGMGFGAGMLTAALEYGRELGCTRIETKVSSNNPDVLALYLALSFQITNIEYVLRRAVKAR